MHKATRWLFLSALFPPDSCYQSCRPDQGVCRPVCRNRRRQQRRTQEHVSRICCCRVSATIRLLLSRAPRVPTSASKGATLLSAKCSVLMRWQKAAAGPFLSVPLSRGRARKRCCRRSASWRKPSSAALKRITAKLKQRQPAAAAAPARSLIVSTVSRRGKGAAAVRYCPGGNSCRAGRFRLDKPEAAR